MNYFSLNLVLALTWVFLTEDFSLLGLLIGFLLGFLVMAASSEILGSKPYTRSAISWVQLLALFLTRLLLANLELARDILRPSPKFRPGIIAFGMDDASPFQMTLLSALTSLTPGTLTVDIDIGRKMLFVHAVHAEKIALLKKQITQYQRLISSACKDAKSITT